MMMNEHVYLSRIKSRQAARSAHLVKARQGAEAIGRDVLALKALGMSVSEVARRVGIPRPTLNEFVTAAEKSTSGLPIAEVPAVPLSVLGSSELVTAVERGGPIVEMVASFAEADVLFLSGEPFARFVDPNYGGGMRIPNLMLRLEDAGWVGVDNVTVGYGGTGPSNAYRALLSIGIDDELAHEVAFYNRVSHVRLDEHGNAEFVQEGRQWPRIGLPAPEPLGDGAHRFCVRMRVGGGTTYSAAPAEDGDPTLNGFYASPPDELTLRQRWLKYLDDPPVWLSGPESRRGTLFTSPEAAAAAGFSDQGAEQSSAFLIRSGHSEYQLIIEQGVLQLWFSAYTSTDPSVWVAPEFHDVLLDAGLLPKDVVEADEASTLRKLLSRHRNRRPASISLGEGDAMPALIP